MTRTVGARVLSPSKALPRLFLGVALVLVGCSSTAAPIPSETNTISVEGSFTSIRAADGFEVSVKRANTHSVQVSTTGVPVEVPDVTIVDDVLQIQTKGTIPSGGILRAVVSAPTIIDVTGATGAQIILQAPMTLGGDDVSVDLTNGATFEGEVSAKSLAVTMQAGAESTISGSSRTVSVVGSQNAQLVATDLVVADADVDLSTAGRASLTVNETLSVRLATGADFRYFGDPKITERKVEEGTVFEGPEG
jgi:hypothetical protein